MNATSLPHWTTELLASCPKAGGGVHSWLYVTALKLHKTVIDQDELMRLLEAATSGCGRMVEEREIINAVVDSARYAEGSLGQAQSGPRWPGRDEELICSVVSTGPTLADLAADSPMRWSDGASHTEEVIDLLFPGNSLLCGGIRKESALTRPREEWRGFLSKQQFIVPNPMSTTYGATQSGKRSMRTLSNVGPRRFLVVEFDQGDFDQHAAILNHLRKYAPLALAVHSGNKSLHGWFFCAGQPEETIKKFFKYAVSLGADPATFTPCQYVRMPDGRRDSGKLQRVVFLNPKAVKAE